MTSGAFSISSSSLSRQLGSSQYPLVIDVRRDERFAEASHMLPAALRRDPLQLSSWLRHLPSGKPILVYCVYGHEVSQSVTHGLRAAGLNACYLDGGFEGWRDAGLPILPKDLIMRYAGSAPSIWMTRARPKIDRVACPWLIRRFLDPFARILYVPADAVESMASIQGAIPFDIPGVMFSHKGDACSFDAFIQHFAISDPALLALANIVRGADTDRLDLAPQAAGLLAASLGLSQLYPDDYEMLENSLALYDALYRWCRDAQSETHRWNGTHQPTGDGK